MNLLLSVLKVCFFFMLFLLKGAAAALLAVLSQADGNKEVSKSIYLLDEDGNEFIDDGVTFGYELEDSFRYRNRP